MDAMNLRAVLTLDKSQYEAGLDSADNKARGFGGKFSKAMKVGVAATAALAAGTALVGKKLVDGAKQVAEYGDHVDKMSQKIGISAESYQKWDYVMKRAGGNVDSLKMGMRTLSQQAEANSDAFQKLGISQEEVASLSKEDLFEKTIKGLSEMEEGTERTALASKLLGRSSADLGPLLNQGSDAIEEQMEIAEKYGMVMPEATVKASAAFEDSMTTLQMTTQGLKNRLLGEFLPAMTQVTDGLALMFTGDMSGLDDVVDGIKNFIGKIGDMIPNLVQTGGKLVLGLIKGLVKKIPDILNSAKDLAMNLMTGLSNSVGNLGGTLSGIVGQIATFIKENAPLMIPVALDLIVSLANGLLQAIPSIIKALPTIIGSIISAFKDYNWANVGKVVITGVANGIKAVGGLLKGAVTKPISAVKSAISNGFSAAKEKAVQWMEKLRKGVVDKIKAAKDKVKEVIDKIKSFFPFSVGKLFSGWIPKISLKTNKNKDSASTSSSVKHEKFAKAMNQPYLFTKPTIFNQQEAGEAGDEMLYGKSALMNDIKEAMQDGMANTTNYFNVTVNGAESPEEWADKFTRQLKLNMRTA